MSWGEGFLGVIAFSMVAAIAFQIRLIFIGVHLVRRLIRFAVSIRGELAPVMAHVQAIGDSASRATALAAMQADRFDDVASAVVPKIRAVRAIVRPVQQGLAFAAALRAGAAVIRRIRNKPARRGAPIQP